MIAATCGLLHDLGNPPFGHAGEAAMREWFESLLMQDSQLLKALGGEQSQYASDFLKFDGNPQTIRLVTHLQMLVDRHGLDLTIATTSVLCKYCARSSEISETPHEFSKAGFFASEQSLVEAIRERTGTGNARHPLTYLVEAADDIVYSVVDIEDGIRKGVLSWEQFKGLLAERCSNKTLLDVIVSKAEGYIGNSEINLHGRSRDVACVQMFRTYAIGEHASAVEQAFAQNYNAIIQGEFNGELLQVGDTRDLWRACKSIARDYIYTAESILRLEIMGREVLQDLLTLFWSGVEGAPERFDKSAHRKLYDLMSRNYREIFERSCQDNNFPRDYCRLQLLADYICGMTDSFATDLHRQLRNG